MSVVKNVVNEFGSQYDTYQKLMDAVAQAFPKLNEEQAQKVRVDEDAMEINSLHRAYKRNHELSLEEASTWMARLTKLFPDEALSRLVTTASSLAQVFATLAFQDMVASMDNFKERGEMGFQTITSALIRLHFCFDEADWGYLMRVFPTIIKDVGGTKQLPGNISALCSFKDKTRLNLPLKELLEEIGTLKGSWKGEVEWEPFLTAVSRLLTIVPDTQFSLPDVNGALQALSGSKITSLPQATTILADIAKDLKVDKLQPLAAWLIDVSGSKDHVSMHDRAQALRLLSGSGFPQHYDSTEEFLKQLDESLRRLQEGWPSLKLDEYVESIMAMRTTGLDLPTMDHIVDGVLTVRSQFSDDIQFHTLFNDLLHLTRMYNLHFLEVCDDVRSLHADSFEQVYKHLMEWRRRYHETTWKEALEAVPMPVNGFIRILYLVLIFGFIIFVVMNNDSRQKTGNKLYEYIFNDASSAASGEKERLFDPSPNMVQYVPGTTRFTFHGKNDFDNC